jgi:hypothetical protein
MTERLEDLTEDTPAWYAATRSKVAAGATLEQAEELRRGSSNAPSVKLAGMRSRKWRLNGLHSQDSAGQLGAER